MTKYLFTLLLIIFSFWSVGCQEKSQPVKQTTPPTQTQESVPTVPVKPANPTVSIKPTQAIVETKPTTDTEQAEILSFIKEDGT